MLLSPREHTCLPTTAKTLVTTRSKFLEKYKLSIQAKSCKLLEQRCDFSQRVAWSSFTDGARSQ